jgi:hypothetical protein
LARNNSQTFGTECQNNQLVRRVTHEHKKWESLYIAMTNRMKDWFTLLSAIFE